MSSNYISKVSKWNQRTEERRFLRKAQKKFTKANPDLDPGHANNRHKVKRIQRQLMTNKKL